MSTSTRRNEGGTHLGVGHVVGLGVLAFDVVWN
jgi:hypothetical protein